MPNRAFRILSACVALSSACMCGPPPTADAVLRISPESLTFDGALLSWTTTKDLTLINDSDVPFAPSSDTAIGGDDAASFTLDDACEFPLAGDQFCTLHVSITPTEARAYAASLTVAATNPITVPITATVRGVTFSPSPVAFGDVAVGSTKQLDVEVENVGDASIDVTFAVEGTGFALEGSGTSVTIAAHATATLRASFAPTSSGAATGRIVADLCSEADCDPFVDLSGNGAVPNLEVQPTAPDFGVVNVGATADLTVNLHNSGTGDLVISALSFDDPTGFVTVSSSITLPATVAPGSQLAVSLHEAPTHGLAALAAHLTGTTNDPDTPTFDVVVTGSTPGAGVAADPRALSFGTLDEGDSATLDVVVRSVGATSASITSIAFSDQAGPFSVSGGPSSFPSPLDPGDSFTLTITASPATDDVGQVVNDTLTIALQGGGDETVVVTVTGGAPGCQPQALPASTNLGRVGIGDTDTGIVNVQNVGTAPCVLSDAVASTTLTFDPVFAFDASGAAVIPAGEQRPVLFLMTPTTTGITSANIEVTFENVTAPVLLQAVGNGVVKYLVPVPATSPFGPLPQGCAPFDRTITLQNTGPQSLVIDSLTLDPPTGSPFTLVSPPATPFSIPSGDSLDLTARAIVQPLGAYTATIHAHTTTANTAHAVLTLDVQPPYTAVTESFVTPDALQADILFVIDNSGSMSSVQEELAANFQLFLDQPIIANGQVDFHMAITTTDVYAEAGRFVGSPKVMTNQTPNLAETFSANALVGTFGSGDEQGLEAIRLAFSPTNLANANAGFLRPTAALALIVVSDENDYSDETVQYYVDYIRNLKGDGLDLLVSLHAVRNPFDGIRYEQAVGAMGGMLLDLSSPGWGPALGDLGQTVFSLPTFVQVVREPHTPSVSVEVGGSPVNDFSVNQGNRLVTLGAAPAAGTPIEVTYQPLCGVPDAGPGAVDAGTSDAGVVDAGLVCPSGFDIATLCTECEAGKYGAQCDQTCTANCGAHGACDDGVAGTGTCACDLEWTGAACDACATGWQDDGSGGCEVAPAVTYDAYGTGTNVDPYLIFTAEQLDDIGTSACGAGPGDVACDAHFRQMVDIDAAGIVAFDPIGACDDVTTAGCAGADDVAFTGHYDGVDHAIANLTIAGADGAGLFSVIGAGGSVDRLTLVAPTITGDAYVGALAGWCDGDVQRVAVVGGSVTATGDAVGGLLGRATGAVVRSGAAATVAGDEDVGGVVGTGLGLVVEAAGHGSVTATTGNGGGLVGHQVQGTITDSYADADVDGAGALGGLVGWSYRGSTARAYAGGDVQSSAGPAGGFYGLVDGPASTTSAFALGDVGGVAVDDAVGAFVGAETGTSSFSSIYGDQQAIVTNGGTGTTQSSRATLVDTTATPTYFQVLTNPPLSAWEPVTWCAVANAAPRLCWE